MDNLQHEEAIIIGVMIARFLFNTHRWSKATDLLIECLVLLNADIPISRYAPLLCQVLNLGLCLGNYIFQCGEECYKRSQFKESIQCHQKGLGIFRAIGSRAGEAWSHCRLGRAFNGVCRYDEANEHYQKALKVPGITGMERKRLEGRVYNNLGEVSHVRGNFDEACSYFKKALKISEEAGNKIEMAVSYNNLGVMYHNGPGKLDKALVYHQKALELRKELGYRIAEGMSYHNVGGVYQAGGEYRKALEYYKKSLAVSKETKNRKLEGNNMLFIGKLYYLFGQLEKAKEYTEKAIEILLEIGAKKAEGGARGELGRLHMALGDYEKAIEQYKKYLKTSEEIGDVHGIEVCHSNIGVMYSSLGEYEKAMKYAKKAIDTLRVLKHQIGLGKAYNTIGCLHLQVGEPVKSFEYLEKAVKLTKETGDRENEATSTNSLGRLYLSLGEHDKAIENAKKSLAIRKEIGHRSGEANSYTLLSSVALAQGQNQRAIDYLSRALEIVKETGVRNEEKFIVLENLGLAYASKKDFAQACDFLLEAIKHHQSTRTSLKDEPDKLSLDSHNFSCFKILSWLLLSQGKVSDALFSLELGRGRALVDLISKIYGIQTAVGATEETSTSLQKLFHQQKTNFLFIARLQDIIALWFVDKSGNIKFKQVSCEKRKKVDVAKDGFGLDRYVLEGQEVQCEDRSLSAFYEDASLNAMERNKEQKKHDAGSEEERERNQSFRQCDTYSVLIAPIEGLIQGPEIIIAPEGEFFMVPFAALKDENGKYLSDRVRIRLVPSLTTLKLIHDSSADYHCTTGALIVGDPKVGRVNVNGKSKELDPLPCAREESQMIARLLGVPCLVGEQATKGEVLRRIQDVSLVHIAAHGDAERGEIALAPNRFVTGIPTKKDFMLTMKDIAEVGIRAKLVVLSCCHSACGKILTTEGVVGIARAFLGSGARSVLMSLCAVDDEATKAFMEIFYKCLIHEKMSASEALHQAMKQMRESSQYQEVKKWAPFVLLGDDVSFDFKK